MKQAKYETQGVLRALFWTVVASAALAACSDGTGTDGVLADVAVSFATQRPAATGAPPPAAPAVNDTLITGGDTLIITTAEIVLREIELRRLSVADCDTAPDTDDCEEFETGPVLVSLPTDGSVQTAFSIQIEADTYVEVEFDIHKVSSGDPEDAAFIAAHPDFVDKSIRVTGTFNGQAFEFTSDLNVEQELTLSPPLVIAEGTTSTNITIFADLDSWFRDASGGLVDPATANKGGDNENLVRDNIQSAFEAFEDEDRDGEGDN